MFKLAWKKFIEKSHPCFHKRGKIACEKWNLKKIHSIWYLLKFPSKQISFSPALCISFFEIKEKKHELLLRGLNFSLKPFCDDARWYLLCFRYLCVNWRFLGCFEGICCYFLNSCLNRFELNLCFIIYRNVRRVRLP